MKKSALLPVILLLSVMTGCVTTKQMGPTREDAQFDTGKTPVLLLSLELLNEHRPSYRMDPESVWMNTTGPDGKRNTYRFEVDRQSLLKTKEGNRYLFRLPVEPGKHQIENIWGSSKKFLIYGNFRMPLGMTVDAKPNTVVYLGRIRGIVRTREEHEFRAGDVIPLIDQAAAGFSNGTFDVYISDASDEDIPTFTSRFPTLSKTTITKQLLPPFDRKIHDDRWNGTEPTSTTGQTPSK